MSLQGGGDAFAEPHEDHKSRPESTASSIPNTGEEADSFEDAVDNADDTADGPADDPADSPGDSPVHSPADIVDSASMRSLTKRSVSAIHSPLPQAETDAKHDEQDPSNGDEKTDGLDNQIDTSTNGPMTDSRRTSPRHSNRTLRTSNLDQANLDNVNLDDENPADPEKPPESSEKEVASKALSLSSITNALPAMPWAPAAESTSKSPGPSLNAAGVPPLASPGPPARKLSSPFSWLSRNSNSKDKDRAASPPLNSVRRNTASSIATLTSNPEMMLSKLEEETEDVNGVNGSQTESLKDRFKVLRMREEAGVHHMPSGHGDGQGDAPATDGADGEGQPGEKGKTAVPTSNHDLAPGTVSGMNAGPSAIQDPQVDWDLWQSVVYEGPAAVARTSPEELNKAIAAGIPNAIRGVIWQVLAQSKNEQLEVTYQNLLAHDDQDKRNSGGSTTESSASNNGNSASTQGESVKSSASSLHSNQSVAQGGGSPRNEKSQEAIAKAQAAAATAAAAAADKKKKQMEDAAALQKLEKVIRRDLGARTSFSKYAAAAGLQEGLFGVCKAYALYDEGVGYAQGMNFLIMPLLFNMPEKEAFCLLVRLMHQYHLRDLFVQDMPGLHLHLYQFERLLEDLEPALYCHLHRRGISPHLFATQWFLTLFAYRFPLQLVLRIYDLILSEGLSAVLRFGIVLMQKNAPTLMGISDMQQLTTYLKDKLFDVYIDKDPSQGSILENGFFGSSSSSMDKEVYRADQLVRDACEVKITPETLKTYTTEWEEKTKAEKDRETELHDLRSANQNFAVQIRKLQDRVQASDREQAVLLTDLVHTRVQNEELRDENESLKGQVKELRNVIEKQPLEIEEAWKLERDDLMKRNAKVHEDNENLAKEMAELEDQLVKTKMQYAEINDQHETLNRRWADLKRQFA